MTDQPYRPWRTGPATPPMDEHTAAAWRDLIGASRHAVNDLRDLVDRADDRLRLGGRLLHQLERRGAASQASVANLARLEHRLTALERRLGRIEQVLNGTSETPPTLLPKTPHVPFDHLLNQLRADAA